MFIRIVISFVLLVNIAHAKKVVTTLPEFAWVVNQLTNSKLEVKSLLSGQEDPHFVDASPAFIFKVAKADLVIMNGMELEVGWLPKVLQMSGNRKVQPGSEGLCDASVGVKKIEVMQNYDRSMGDVHPAGNPHYTASIPRMLESANTIKTCLSKLGIDSKLLEKNYKVLSQRMNKTYKALQKEYKAKSFYVYHREFNYLKQDYKIKMLESLEEVPGVLPSATFLSKLAIKAKKDKPFKVLANMTSPTKVLNKFKELSGVGFEKIPLHPKVGESYLDFTTNMMKKIMQD